MSPRKSPPPAPAEPLESLWQRLRTVARFETMMTQGPASRTGWEGVLRGTVTVEDSSDTLEFIEDGHLHPPGRQPVAMHNHLRWERLPAHLRLSHCRQGNPILLVELVPHGPHLFTSREAHLCGADRYALELQIHPDALHLHWRITGPRKDEHLHTTYRG
ncbi:MAG: DUF6314 family protein [Opitutales bacterium]